jgi:uncharacterized protein (DUF1501 family)
MQPTPESRRHFLTSGASGIGLLALASLLRDDGLLAAEARPANPLAPKPPHFAPKARRCICFYLEGAPSQLDLWDPKPKLNELHGQPLPQSMTKNVRFAFIRKDGARLLGSPRKFHKHGHCGMDLSDFLPHLARRVDDIAWIRSLHTDAFNHHPGQLLMCTGRATFGLPSLGAWLNYGLGSPSQNLPGYVVLTAGRGPSGGATTWQSGFLPSPYAGVLFRGTGEPVLNLNNPAGLDNDMQRQTIDALADLNRLRRDTVRDPEIDSRIAAYELAFRMQSAAPELIDLSGETKQTLEMYGVGREDRPLPAANRGGGKGQYHQFAANCLLARRLIERGVRFVNLYHASWDHHSNLDAELGFNAGMADQPVAALIQDLKQRGLLDETLVVWMSEFGRTPLGENREGYKAVTGRDHHPFAFTLWMAGGGVKGGTILGKTDDLGWNVVEDPVHVNDFHATILHLFGLDHLKLTYRFQGRDFRLTDVAGRVVNKLLS